MHNVPHLLDTDFASIVWGPATASSVVSVASLFCPPEKQDLFQQHAGTFSRGGNLRGRKLDCVDLTQ